MDIKSEMCHYISRGIHDLERWPNYLKIKRVLRNKTDYLGDKFD